MLSGTKFTIDAYNRESFYRTYKTFCEHLIKEVIRKNSSMFSNNYLERMNKNDVNTNNETNMQDNQNSAQYSQGQENAIMQLFSTSDYPHTNQQM